MNLLTVVNKIYTCNVTFINIVSKVIISKVFISIGVVSFEGKTFVMFCCLTKKIAFAEAPVLICIFLSL